MTRTSPALKAPYTSVDASSDSCLPIFQRRATYGNTSLPMSLSARQLSIIVHAASSSFDCVFDSLFPCLLTSTSSLRIRDSRPRWVALHEFEDPSVCMCRFCRRTAPSNWVGSSTTESCALGHICSLHGIGRGWPVARKEPYPAQP